MIYDFKTLPWDFDFQNIELLKQVNKTNIALGKLEAISLRLPNSRVLIEFLSMKEGVKSNAIENINTTVADAFFAEVIGKNLANYENKETINYKTALIQSYHSLLKKGGVGYNDILKINTDITGNDIGVYSSPNKHIKKGDKIIYTPPVGKDLIESLLKNFEKYYNTFNEEKEIDPLLKLPLLHYQFEAIHPFIDGNGRTGRILIILFLVLHKKISLPILFFSDFVNNYKDEYYKYLHSLDKQKEKKLLEFTLWMLKGIEKNSLETAYTVEKILELQIFFKTDFKKDPDIKKFYSKDLIDYLFANPIYSIESLLKSLPQISSRQTASKYLNVLKMKGYIDDYHHKKCKFFYNKSFLDILVGESRYVKENEDF